MLNEVAMKRLVLDKSELLLKLLTYLRENQDKKEGISKENLAKYLREQELSSRMTTFSIIDTLKDEKMLLDNKVMNYQSNLRINPEYDFDGLLENIIQSQIQELHLKLAKFAEFTKREESGIILDQLSDFSKVFSLLTGNEDKRSKNLRKSPEGT